MFFFNVKTTVKGAVVNVTKTTNGLEH